MVGADCNSPSSSMASWPVEHSDVLLKHWYTALSQLARSVLLRRSTDTPHPLSLAVWPTVACASVNTSPVPNAAPTWQ